MSALFLMSPKRLNRQPRLNLKKLFRAATFQFKSSSIILKEPTGTYLSEKNLSNVKLCGLLTTYELQNFTKFVLYMSFDRFLLAVESRDLSQADKSII